ncbi:3-hydroxyacyl-CoA dehydrogenase [Hydrogenophaga sp. PAMC20947]|uniref:3-hydroxyacyl-CoA dehydrogenase n=1 Tax=Hydrogenophaga sp. PAMC20947 TaxID=2565558 RepID=UPI00109DA812|nr:3-hydroxyacyl-CoA dehydrogenase [Hydrogenophaga sp. PAMC20947]QCB45315.1 3-hydroxyacyl-CoA dehydrogenase [Hydrogenophaga sp. PAMC20947]
MQAIFPSVGVIGTGAMGRGIAQMAAQAGSEVRLYDVQAGAAQAAKDSLWNTWSKLVAKNKLGSEEQTALISRISVIDSLQALEGCAMVIEAVVERLDIKQQLFAELEPIVGPDTVLATNTSSLSVTAIAAALTHPERFAGFHFFNPVPLMRVVEIIAGLRSSAVVCEQLAEFAKQFGHTPVSAQDTPGFIVNHAGRGYGTEALRVVGERVADFATIDRILRDQIGFKLGPFELMDLTALDVSHPVMESIYRQYFDEPRYRPSVITAQRLAGGVLGKKTGAGFYRYEQGVAQIPPEPAIPTIPSLPPVWVSPKAARRTELYQLLKTLGAQIETTAAPSSGALILVAPLGLDVTTLAAVERLDASRTVGIDMMLEDASTRRRVLATNPATRIDMRDAAHALFAKDGKAVSVVRDSGGFVSQRVVATIINIAADMCQQGVCTPKDLDLAVTLGLGYPVGPLALGDRIGPTNVLEILFNMQTVYGDPRYRPSPWLRRRGALGLSLAHEEI